MLNYLEQLLEKKTQGKKDEILYTQWKLAKNHVPQVLANIANIFPHYTLHDRTHSEAILTNITRILGQKIFEEHFSSIDLWLLLCAAFYHDMGMAPFAPDLDKILKDEEFFLYFREIKDNPKHILHNQASYFEVAGKKISWKNNEISLERIEAFKFILAEYIRRNHGERTENTLKNDPSLYLPSNPIPQRLINLLGKICECHTKSFEKVMELPFEEAGLEYEPCHPRFIACLLRLGDLLDLDNNRVSEIVLRTIKTIPAESFFHIQKHLSISHLNINSKQIDITAECEGEKGYKTADLASSWFSWLDKEITDQMKNWNQIVPNQEFGFLPTVGNLKVELKDYDSIDGKVHPKFEIDTQKAIEMLQGANLYSEPFQSIREILQNSVDATYLRIWVENKDSNSNMTFEKFAEECRKGEYAIRVKIEKNEKSSDDEKIVWHITISDSGLGMSQEDLKFLYKTGSSSQNKEKLKYLAEMPEYMKPSGTFGIGFQSIFLITDKVHIRTRKYNSGDVYDIDLYSPTGEDNGTILLKTTKTSNFKVGTEVSFDFKTHKIPEEITYSIDQYHDNRTANANISNYDFIEYQSLDFKIGKIIDKISDFADASYIQIKLLCDSKENIINSNSSTKFEEFSKETNLEFSIDYWGKRSDCTVYYRNQLVKKSKLGFYFLHISVNILDGDAKNILTLNRNEINNKYVKTLEKNVVVTVLHYLKENFSNIQDDKKTFASAFAYVYKDMCKDAYKDIYKGDLAEVESKYSDIFTCWEEYPVDFEINGNKEKKSMGYFINNENINSVKIMIPSKKIMEQPHFPLNNTYELTNDCLLIHPDIGSLNITDEWVLLHKAFSQYFKSISYFENGDTQYVLHKKDNLPLIDEDGWKSWFREVYLNNLIARGHIPCNPDYVKLAIKDDYIFPYSQYTPYPMDFYYPKMVSPYVIERTGDSEREKRLKVYVPDGLIDFVFKNRKDENVTKAEIRETYEKFIKDREDVVREINEELNLSNQNK